MPELPEVETVRRGLEPWLSGKKIKKLEVLHRGANRATTYLPLDAVNGARIISIRRRGKFLWFELDRDFALIAHLGMSGQFIVREKGEPLEAHARARLDFGDRRREIRFIDQRTFGWIAIDDLVETERGLVPRSMRHIAPDIFETDYSEIAAVANIRRRKSEIKRVLLNQEIVSGIGNIYADEALWYSKIHPERIASNLSEVEVRSILKAVKKVMKRALDAGGTTFDDLYIKVNGESGYFDISLRAYGQDGEGCRRCGAVIRRIAFANRSSHFCPRCQVAPRRVSSKGTGKKYGKKYGKKKSRKTRAK